METLAVRTRNQDAVALWTRRITDCKNSGLHTGDWCAENGINVKTYYYWHNKIHKMVNQHNGFYEIPVASGNRGVPAVTIRIGVMQADIYSGADYGTIQSVCRAMKAC